MLNFLYDFIPIILFFIAFKVYGIYAATVVGIVVSGLQFLMSTLWKKTFDKKQFITFIVFLIFGGMTLYFHNPIFVKWKPTIIYWIFGVILFFSHFIGPKPLMQRFLEPLFEKEKQIVTTIKIWKNINMAWAFFFLFLGGLNLVVAYHFSTNAWVNFKLYGTLGLIFLFIMAQSMYLAKNMTELK